MFFWLRIDEWFGTDGKLGKNLRSLLLAWEDLLDLGGLGNVGRLGIVGQLDQGGAAWHECDGVSTGCSEFAGYGALCLPSFDSFLR